MDGDTPEEFDWRKKNAVAEVVTTWLCDAAYAFPVTGAVEALHSIQSGYLDKFSEQQIVDCSGAQGNFGCTNGTIANTYKYVEQQPLELMSGYPWRNMGGKC